MGRKGDTQGPPGLALLFRDKSVSASPSPGGRARRERKVQALEQAAAALKSCRRINALDEGSVVVTLFKLSE